MEPYVYTYGEEEARPVRNKSGLVAGLVLGLIFGIGIGYLVSSGGINDGESIVAVDSELAISFLIAGIVFLATIGKSSVRAIKTGHIDDTVALQRERLRAIILGVILLALGVGFFLTFR